MATEVLDCNGMKCPQPVLKVAIQARKIAPGTTLEVLADCSAFPNDIKKWCEKNKKTLLSCSDTGGGAYKAQIQF